jgi:S1-C subfamily serine protease
MLSIQGTEPKITNGIINSLSGINDDPRMYQISVPVQPGNSGGALVTIDGLVVGVVTAKLSASNTLKTTGSLPENVNYAVKSNYLLELLRSHKVRAKVETRASGKELRLVDLAARVEKATGLIIVKNKVVRRGSPEVEQEIERQCQHERTYRGKAAFERCAEDVVNQINRDAK